jgi:GT2 family glycosyltransferase
MTLEVSVVVPTYNRVERLQRVLAALASQTYPRHSYEIIVVSDGSTDGTDEMLRCRPATEVVLATQPNAGPAAARNRGVGLASGGLLLFIDDDVVATPELIERHVQSHREGGDGQVVIGPMATPPDAGLSPWVQWEQTMLYRQYRAMVDGVYEPTPRQFYTGNASVPRGAVVAVGGFDTRFRRAEDIELAYRLEDAGLRFTFNPGAIGYHHAERSFASWLQNAYDYGVCDVVFAREQGRHSVGEVVEDGFRCRPALLRWMISACINRPRLDVGVRSLYRGSYSIARALQADRVSRLALSGLYNNLYYRGVADQLGGTSSFRKVVGQGCGWLPEAVAR